MKVEYWWLVWYTFTITNEKWRKTMDWITQISDLQWVYIVIKVITIIGFLFASGSMLLTKDKSILNKSYNTLPDLKFSKNGKELIVLNVPVDRIYQTISEEMSLFVGFCISSIGMILDIFVESEKMPNSKHLFISIATMSAIGIIVLKVVTVALSWLRCSIIMNKIERNRISPDAYNAFETDNVVGDGGNICSKKYTKECSWERMIINGNVEDKNTEI